MAKILIVDDEPLTVDILSSLLHLRGHTSIKAHSVRQALDSLASEKPDAILLDVMLPDGNGLDLCKQLRTVAKWDAVPIIINSACGMSRTSDAQAVGADEYLPKPIRHDALWDTLSKFNIA